MTTSKQLGLVVWQYRWDVTFLRWLSGWCDEKGLVKPSTSRQHAVAAKMRHSRRGGLAPDAPLVPLDLVDDYVFEEEDFDWLRSLNPADWKEQDHYALLGLKNLRWRASDKCIKRAYKAKVLRHHPDKRRGRGEVVDDDNTDYFTCITYANDVLGVEARRRAYDSVDPQNNDEVAALGAIDLSVDGGENFYEYFGKLFAENARWSKKRPVPALGNATTEWHHVENFYDFWYHFDSWREFSYLDEEDKDKGENRDERRWIEKQNKVARQRLRNDEMRRLARLVETARSLDPRVAQHNMAERDARENEKTRRRNEQQARQLQLDKEKAEREAAEEEVRRVEAQKRADAADAARREAQCKRAVLKKERRTLRQRCREWEYFALADSERMENMALCETLTERLSVGQLVELNSALQPTSARDAAQFAFERAIADLRIEQQQDLGAGGTQLKTTIQSNTPPTPTVTTNGAASKKGTTAEPGYWCYELTQGLIKAVKVFPAGTHDRWETMAAFLNQHVAEANGRVTAKDVLRQTKAMQQDDSHLRKEVNRQAYARLAENVRTTEAAKESVPTERIAADVPCGVPWSADEQRTLEQALRTYGPDTPNRWECISQAVPGRSKRECMLRFKELAARVQAKKVAMATAAATPIKK